MNRGSRGITRECFLKQCAALGLVGAVPSYAWAQAQAAKEESKKGSEVKNEKMWAHLMHQRVYIDDLVLCRLGE